MKLITLNLTNIRSYTTCSLNFPNGIVMLSGDIGSGKSTILQAIEFALFGLVRGELSGGGLLRHGTQNGNCELTFEVENKKYTIKRTLKKTSKSVEQGSGYLICDNVKQVATATELKSKILEILGYPDDLLTKGKNFIYRYTVYTPQEAMKNILLETSENRLAILRKVFAIDKYATISENANTYAKELRGRKRALDHAVADLEDKKSLALQTKEQIDHSISELSALCPKLELIRNDLQQSKATLLEIETKRTEQKIIEQKIAVAKNTISTSKYHEIQSTQDIQNIDLKLQEYALLPALSNTDKLTSQITLVKQQIQTHENKTRELTSTLSAIKTRQKHSKDICEKIQAIDHCPTCFQDVTPDHKHSIITTEQGRINAFEKKHNHATAEYQQVRTDLISSKQQLETSQKELQETKLLQLKHQSKEELKIRKEKLSFNLEDLKNKIRTSQLVLKELELAILPHLQINSEHKVILAKHDHNSTKERELSLLHAKLTTQHKLYSENEIRLLEEIAKKQDAKNNLEKTQHTHHWITDNFIPLMSLIEQHVMAKIHHEFSAMFESWFSMLVEDLLNARLDNTFTPIVQQNGFDVNVNYLSGGERTACALAYRLSLNKTINSLINSIKTKDLLILDEPSDGFSSEQLDKMREVLAELKLKQIIIVSHEQKVEGFADHIIRIQKEGHVSNAV